MVVQETASSTGKGSSKATSVAGAGVLAGVALAGLLGMAAPLHAQIVGAPNVPGNLRPTVLVAPNGVPLVNIQTPSAAGVSRNIYNQFNVGANGAILNNSRANVQTQLGGFVQGNPNLATGAARIILNEVNGGSPSQLRGYIEVGGQRAEVIIANPAGISVDGGGFINASRATLTTGTPQFNAVGGLDSFLVRGGTITIDGAGLDASKTDYAAILARAVQANAGIWASELKVVTGANQVSADHSQVTPTAGTGAAPTFALDVAALGGMYANKINLIGTEAGLGVRNAGNIGAGAGGLVVTAAGRLENIGTLEGQRVELSTPGDIDNRKGTIRQTSVAGLTIGSPILSNTNGGVIGSEPVSAGTTGGGAVGSGAGTPVSGGSGGGASTPSSAGSGGGSGDAGGSSTPAVYMPPAPGAITAGGTIFNDAGRIYAGGPITLSTPQINNAGGTLNVATMAVAGPSFSNAGGTLNVSNSFSANVGRLDNSGGTLHAGNLQINTTGDLVNVDGKLTSDGDASLMVGGNADNTRGSVSATGSLTAGVTGAFNNASGTLLANNNVALTAGSLDNTKGSIQSVNARAQLGVANQLTNAGGSIGAGTDVSVQAGSLSNSGSIRGANDASLTISGGLSNDGSITAGRNTTITAGSVASGTSGVLGAGVQNDGKLASAGNLSVTASDALVANGTNLAAGNVVLQGASVDLSSSQTSAANITATADKGNVTTSGATVTTPGTLSITANSQAAQTFVNNAGKLNAGQLDLHASNIANTNGGEIVQTGTGAITVAVSGTLNNDGSRIASNGQDMSLSAATLTNTGGRIEHAGTGTLNISGGSYSGANGKITGNGALTVAMSGNFGQDGGATSAKQITIDAGALSNRGGQIIQTGTEATRITVVGAVDNTAGTIASNGNMAVAAGSLNNQGGTVRAAETSNLDLSVGGALDNSSKGVIGAGGSTTVAAGSLNNNTGGVTAVGDLKATVGGAATNVGGTLAANGNTTVVAGTLDNSSGTTAAVNGDLGVTTSGVTTNNSGTLQAGAKTTLINGGLSNVGGKVFGDSLSVDTKRNALNNAQGTLAATTTVNLQSGALTNDAGLIQSGKAMTIQTNGQGLSNANAASYATGQGGITSGDTLDLTSGTVNNASGFVGAKGALKANTQAFTNTSGGVVMGQSSVTVNTNGTAYNNSGGQTLAMADLGISAGGLTNTGGLIRSATTTTLNAGSVGNTSTQGTNQGIEGKNVVIGAGSLDNTSGAIRADVDTTITSGGTVNNSSGLISAVNALTIQDPNSANPGAKTLNLINASGTLVADKSLRIDAANFSGDGKAISGKDLSIALTQNVVNNGEVAANGNLSYTTTGSFTNNGKLLAGQTLTVGGSNVDNTVNAEMSGINTTVNAGGTLTNRGLIDSKGSTQINAGALNNIGTGRIYGNAISIAAGTVSNDAETLGGITKAGTIAARESLNIGAGTVSNREHSLIFSGGFGVDALNIGGALDANRRAIGQGGTLNNLSADIESLGGMSISMGQVNNRDVHIQKGAPTVTPSVLIGVAAVTPVGNGTSQIYLLNQVRLDPVNGLMFLIKPDGSEELIGMDGYGIWNNNLTTTEDTAVNLDPAHLVAGGNMTVNGRLYNENSQVLAGGTITATDYKSSQLTGERQVIGFATVVNNKGEVQATNVPLIVAPTTINLGAYKYQEHTNAASGNNTGVAPIGGVSGSASGAGGVSGSNGPGFIVEVAANVGIVVKTTGKSADEARGSAGGGAAGASQTIPMVVRTSSPNTRVPTASLFNLQAGAGRYLIETDPRFTNYRNWLSSDYLLSSLGLDPDSTLKRLGDGFYEQKLIREQVAQLTGYRYLEGFVDDEDQYASLMNAGATLAKQYGLRPGVALTAAQMAQLTSDIVWLVEQTVTLPDGSTQRALVPQVYVRVRPGDIDGSGALLSADATVIKSSGDVVNTGTIAGRSLVSINADNMRNLGGRIIGGDIGINARTDVDNIGGTIKARNSAILIAGRDVNIRTTTQSVPSSTVIDRVAGVYVTDPGGVLLASAGRDANLIGAILANTGVDSRTLVNGERNVNLGTVTEASSAFSSGGSKSNRVTGAASQSKEVGTMIVGGGSIALTAGNDLSARTAGVAAAGTLLVSAGHDVRIDAGQATQSVLTTVDTSRKKLLSRSSSSEIDAKSETTSLGSSFSGKDVVISAGNDLSIRGSQVRAEDKLALTAGRDVRIESAQEQSANGNVSRSSQSGFTGLKDSILYGRGYSSSSSKSSEFSSNVTQVGSTISGGNVSIDAGRDAQIIASNVLADKNIAIAAGRNIDVLAAQDLSVSTTTSSGKSLSLSPSPGIAPRHTLYSNAQGSGNGTGQSSTAVTSLISANSGNLTMVAGLDPKYAGTGQGNITTEGADLLAMGKVTLSGNAVNLNAATSTGSSTHHAESKNHTIGAQLSGLVGSAITRAYDMAQASRNTDDSRLKGALQLKAGYDAYKLATNGALGNGIQSLTAEGTGGDPSGALFGVSVSESRTRSRSDTAEVYSNQRGTNIQAGSIDITARETDITMQGAKLQARDIALDAKRDINMLAAENKAATLSTNSGSSLGGGVTFGFGSQNGFSIQVNAGSSSGKATGTEIHYDNTLVSATDSVRIKSGGDLNMKGAQVTADSVKADVGGNLNIESLQDSTTYASKQSSSGVAVSLCIPPICLGETVSVTVDASKQRVDHNYRSATGQSGIAAGAGGFDLTVKGNTDLKGSAITSKAPEEKNSLVTGSLTTSDLQNQQNTSSSSSSVSLSVSSGANAFGAGTSAATNAARSATNTALANLNNGRGLPGSNSQTSQTLSVISPGSIKIIGVGVKEVDDKSLANVATLTSREPATANGALVNTLTLQQANEIPRLQQEAQDRQRAAQLIGSVVNNVIGDVSASLNRQAQDQENKRATAAGEPPKIVTAWADGSAEKTALHGLSGLIQARVGDASALAGVAAGVVNEQLLPVMAEYLKSQGIKQESAEFSALMMAGSTLVGAVVGSAAGGNSGATIAATVATSATANNFLKHDQANAMNKDLNACKAKGSCSDEEIMTIFNRYKRLSDQNIAQVQSCIFLGNVDCVDNAKKDAASRGEVENTALNQSQLNILTVRQTNAATNSVTGGDGVTNGDSQRAQEVAKFRGANCSTLSVAQCDAAVVQSMKNGQLMSVAAVGAALGLGPAIEVASAATAALVGAIRGCAVNPFLCASQASIVAADAATMGGGAGVGALTVGEIRAVGGNTRAVAQLLEDAAVAGRAPAATANIVARPPSGLSALTEMTPVSASAGGTYSAKGINSNAFVMTDLTAAEQALAARVAARADGGGALTEQLVESVAQRQGLTSLAGGKYGSNNGYDHVLEGAGGNVTILLDSKQMVNGATKVSTNAAGGTVQMSDAWVVDVLSRLDPASPAAIAVTRAMANGTLVKGIAGVDRATGALTIFRVQ